MPLPGCNKNHWQNSVEPNQPTEGECFLYAFLVEECVHHDRCYKTDTHASVSDTIYLHGRQKLGHTDAIQHKNTSIQLGTRTGSGSSSAVSSSKGPGMRAQRDVMLFGRCYRLDGRPLLQRSSPVSPWANQCPERGMTHLRKHGHATHSIVWADIPKWSGGGRPQE